MDLPSCPSCRQSVLDDDAEVCPFCGAPMKGGSAARPATAAPRPSSRPEPKEPAASGPKPSSAPAAAAAAAKPTKAGAATAPAGPVAKSAQKAASSKSVADSAVLKKTLEARPASLPPGGSPGLFDDGGDPLDVKSTAGRNAIPASRQRTKSKPYKVTCPMCETVGYLPQSAAGKEVRCANPKCLVPVFTAPRIERKTAEAPPPAKSGMPVILLGLLFLLILGGAGAWYLYNQPPARPPKTTDLPFRPPTAPNQPLNPVAPPNQQPVNPPVVENQLTLAEERDAVLDRMEQDAKNPERNLRPPYCQRVTAQTAADCGDLKRAKTYLDLLPQGKVELAFYRVGPLTAIAWQHLAKGDKAAAGHALDDALAAAGGLPLIGRYSVESAAWLAAALVAAGRDHEAHDLVAKYPAKGASGRLVAAMSKAAAWNHWDPVAGQRECGLVDLDSLQSLIVVEIAVAKGFPAEALRFAEGVSNSTERTETELAWAEAVERAREQAKSAAAVAIDPILGKLKPTTRARLEARLGSVRLLAKDRPGAEKRLQSALASLGTVVVKQEFVIPPIRKLATLEFADPGPARLEALALAEIARLEGALDKRNEAQKHLSQAVDLLRASAPNLNAARAKVDEATRLRARALEKPIPPKEHRQKVLAEMKHRNQQEAMAALEKIQKMSKLLSEAAKTRFALQTRILETALAWDEPTHLWKEIEPRATATDIEQKEAYFDTLIPWQLAVDLGRAGNQAAAEKINQAAGSNLPPAGAVLDLLAQKAPDSDMNKLVRQMQSIPGTDRADRERATLEGATYLLHAGKVADAFVFVRLFDDPLLKEEALQWTAALACRLNFTRQTKDILHAASFIPTESVSAYRGFLLGLLARDIAPDSTSPADAAGKPPAAEAKHAL
jgi:hypothetical protein